MAAATYHSLAVSFILSLSLSLSLSLAVLTSSLSKVLILKGVSSREGDSVNFELEGGGVGVGTFW